jgi:2-keto-4-pentenoate hydratase/2-oxohepta-3-ene-1,7-dioic acid hydratase in catechol pathway
MGPDIVLTDEIADPAGLVLRSYVSGELMQDSQTSDVLFSVQALIECLTRLITLQPGDVVSTGTPAGVGTFRDPPRYLQPGDTVSVEVDRIGVLTNPVTTGW